MDFSFIHAADLHLGSPFLGLSSEDPELAKRVASASREAFEDLVTEAINRAVAFMLIAGDIYDGDWRDTTIAHFFNRQMGRLHRAGIPVFLIKGNHDADSVITGSITLPDSVQSFPSRKAATFRIPDLKVAIHGQSFADSAVSENLALGYPIAETGWFNIGVLHTSCDGRTGHGSYAPCDLAHLLQRGYQYWALGHIHKYEVLNSSPPVIFPGNLQGRLVGECVPKGAIIVEVRDGEVHTFERILLARIRWAVIEVDLTGVATNDEAFAKIQQAIQTEVKAAGNTPIVFRMVLRGETPLNRSFRSDTHQVSDEVAAAAAHCTELI
jgi:DNA repair exonuclease SbcCD nuclease subunit